MQNYRDRNYSDKGIDPKIRWSSPWYGVEHVLAVRNTAFWGGLGKAIPYQITLTKYDNGKTYIYLLFMDRDRNENVFSPIKEFWGDYIEAKTIGEEWARQLTV